MEYPGCIASLFRKDIRRHREEYSILLFVSVVLGLAGALNEPEVFNQWLLPRGLYYPKVSAYFEMIQVFLFPVFLYAFPVLFLYSTVTERTTGQGYQIYSLPCCSDRALSAKYASVIVMGMAIYLTGQIIRMAIFPKAGAMMLYHCMDFLAMIVFFCGISCAIEGCFSLVKRNRILLGMGLFVAAVLFMSLTRYSVQTAINQAVFSAVPIHMHYQGSPYRWIPRLLFHLTADIYQMCIGLLLAAAGILLTRKYRDL